MAGVRYCTAACWLVFLMITAALVAVLSGLVYVITNPVIEPVFASKFVISSNVRARGGGRKERERERESRETIGKEHRKKE